MSCPAHLYTCEHFLLGILKKFQPEVGIYSPLHTSNQGLLQIQDCAGCQRPGSKERPFEKQRHGSPILMGKKDRTLRSKGTRVLEAFCGDLAGVRTHSSRKLT